MKTTTSYAFAIPLADKDTWANYVSKAYKYDFYHTWDYHEIAQMGEPLLFVYEEDEDFIALPLLKRDIPNTNYVDFHSVYGYTGPIANMDFDLFSEEFISEFQEALFNFFQEQNCISAFVKFHPHFNQIRALRELGGVYDNGKTVSIDLKPTIEEIRKKYKTSTRKCIMKSRLQGLTSRLMRDQEDIRQFTILYNQSMDRIGASGFYKFNEDYFTALLNSNECNAKLLLIYLEDRLICGSVFTANKGIVQAHLLATDSNYFQYSPTKFLIDEICVLGKEYGMEYFHLGGGQGYKDNSLLQWKLAFSDFAIPHKSWRYIVDQEIYNELVEQSGNDIHDTVDFFPLYRLTT